MIHRRTFLSKTALVGLAPIFQYAFSKNTSNKATLPVVLSTWDAGIRANEAAWKILSSGGHALDAVEAGVKVTELEQNCCVGLGANPDREGKVTLDASIMDHLGNCGAVAALERIQHPISVARRVMEKTPHTFIVGQGAQQFAISEGFPLMPDQLSPSAQKAYQEWLKKSEYKPIINIENQQQTPYLPAPSHLPDGTWNHDTIGMIAIDQNGNLSGSCTTSGMGFKMRGRVGDSPVIGAGLYVDNQVGAATATGQGEDIIRICGSFLVVEFMRQGLHPTEACKKAIERLIQLKGKEQACRIQACFIAIDKKGNYGGYSLQKGFTFAVYQANGGNRLVKSSHILPC